MPKYVAFLRAVNVGGRTVKMDDLSRMFEGMGFDDVSTFIASGNVVFVSRSRDGKAIENKIEKSLREVLGFEVATFVRSTAELKKIAEYESFDNPAGGSIFIAFLGSEPESGVRRKVLAYGSKTDEFRFRGRELYWLCRTRMMESKFSGALLEKIIGMPTTLRNRNTIDKIVARFI